MCIRVFLPSHCLARGMWVGYRKHNQSGIDMPLLGLFKQYYFWGSESFAFTVKALPINVLQKDPDVVFFLLVSQASTKWC